MSLTRAQLGTSAHHHIHKEGGTKSPGRWQKTVQPYLGFRGTMPASPFHISNRSVSIFLFQSYLGCRGQSDDVQTRLLPLVRKATYAAQHLQVVGWFKSKFDFFFGILLTLQGSWRKRCTHVLSWDFISFTSWKSRWILHFMQRECVNIEHPWAWLIFTSQFPMFPLNITFETSLSISQFLPYLHGCKW